MSDPLLKDVSGEKTAGFANVASASSAAQKETLVTSTTSEFSLGVNLVTSGLGIGILSLPWSAAGASVIPGIIVVALVMIAMAWTTCIIVEAGERYQTFDLGALLALLPGRMGTAMEWFVNGVIWITGLMALLGYLIVIPDSLKPLTAGTALDNRNLAICMTSLVCLPLCFMDQSWLSFTSSLAIAVNVYLVVIVFLLDVVRDGPISVDTDPIFCLVGMGRGIISLTSTMCMAIAVPMFVLPLYETLENRSVAKCNKVVWTSFGFLFILFAGFQTVAICTFGTAVGQDVLAALPNNIACDLARFGMLPLVLGVYPLNVIPLVAPVRHASWGGEKVASLVTVGIVVTTTALATAVYQLGVLNVLSGAISIVAFDAMGPGLTGIYLVKKGKVSMVLLILAGVAILFLGFLLPENYVADLQDGCAIWR